MIRIQRITIAALAFLSVASVSFAHEGEHSGKDPNGTPHKSARKSASIAGAKTLSLKLQGLHCAGCAISVRSRLMKVNGVASASVNAEKQSATVTLAKGAKRPPDAALKAAVKSAGYTCTAVKG